MINMEQTRTECEKSFYCIEVATAVLVDFDDFMGKELAPRTAK